MDRCCVAEGRNVTMGDDCIAYFRNSKHEINSLNRGIEFD